MVEPLTLAGWSGQSSSYTFRRLEGKPRKRGQGKEVAEVQGPPAWIFFLSFIQQSSAVEYMNRLQKEITLIMSAKSRTQAYTSSLRHMLNLMPETVSGLRLSLFLTFCCCMQHNIQWLLKTAALQRSYTIYMEIRSIAV